MPPLGMMEGLKKEISKKWVMEENLDKKLKLARKGRLTKKRGVAITVKKLEKIYHYVLDKVLPYLTLAEEVHQQLKLCQG